MTEIYKTGYFESAHKLNGHPKCGKLHGHSYRYEVWIKSTNLQSPYRFVIDFHEIKAYFQQFDHSDTVITVSCEVLAKKAHRFFKKSLSQGSIKVRIWETSTSYAEYTE